MSTFDDRVPELLRDAIIGDFLSKYLTTVDRITAYRASLAPATEKTWTVPKLMATAREAAFPEDASVEVPAGLQDAWNAFEAAQQALQIAKRSVVDIMRTALGIEDEVGGERDEAVEAELKTARAEADNIAKTIQQLAKLSGSDAAKQQVMFDFLAEHPLPSITSERTTSYVDEKPTTPKYRVRIIVSDDENEKLQEDGFSKTAQAVRKFYDNKSEAPTAETLRQFWEDAEKAGWEDENFKQITVKVGHLFFRITAK